MGKKKKRQAWWRDIALELAVAGLICAAVVAQQTWSAFAAKAPANKFAVLDQKGFIYQADLKGQHLSFVGGNLKPLELKIKTFQSANAAGAQFLKEYASFFGVGNVGKNLQALPVIRDTVGYSHLLYAQKYQNIPVFGGQLLVHTDKNFQVTAASGRLADIASLKTTPKLKEAAAAAAVVNNLRGKFDGRAVAIKDKRLTILNKSLYRVGGEDKNYLAWQITAVDANSGLADLLFVDAQNGNILETISDSPSMRRIVLDCANGDPDPCYLIAGAPAGARGRAETTAASGIADVDDVFDDLYTTHRYWEAKFHLNGATNQGGTGTSESEYNTASTTLALARHNAQADLNSDGALDNLCPWIVAFWNGYSLNFCPGQVNLKVLAHEYTHALIDKQMPTPLIYHGESGAIEEGLADIFAMAAVKRNDPAVDWTFGGATVIRDLSDPHKYNQPESYRDDAFYGCAADDEGEVHKNSSVMSSFAYLLTEGGERNGCRIPSIGFDRVQELLFHALKYYLPANANFWTLRAGVVLACGSLWGYDSSTCEAVYAATEALQWDQSFNCVAGKTAPTEARCLPPRVTAITSPNASGYYRAGQKIDFKVDFSKAVTATRGSLEPVMSDALSLRLLSSLVMPGSTAEPACSLNIKNKRSAICSYTVQDGDNNADLDAVVKTGGTIVDSVGQVLASGQPVTAFKDAKDIKIDTAAPQGSVTVIVKSLDNPQIDLKIAASDNLSGLDKMRFSNNGAVFSAWRPFEATVSGWDVRSGANDWLSNKAGWIFAQFMDKAGNISDAVSVAINAKQAADKTMDRAPVTPELAPDDDLNSVVDSVESEKPGPLSVTDAGVPAVKQKEMVADKAIPVKETTVRTPSIGVNIATKGTALTVSGVINSYGSGGSCAKPRPSDPVVVRWGDSLATPLVNNMTFAASHDYKKSVNRDYGLSISVTNGCYGQITKHYTIWVGLDGLRVDNID